MANTDVKKSNKKVTTKGKTQNKKKNSAPAPLEYVKPGMVEYKMSADEIADLLASRRGPEAKMSKQDFLCQYINDERGLLGNCVRVIAG